MGSDGLVGELELGPDGHRCVSRYGLAAAPLWPVRFDEPNSRIDDALTVRGTG